MFLCRLWSLFRGRELDRELDDEVQAHLDLAVAEHQARGMAPEEAVAAAHQSFGGVEPMKERYRDQRGFRGLDALLQDLRYAGRQFRKSPRFSSVAILTLAAGIGASTAVYGCLHSLLSAAAPPVDLSVRVSLWSKHPAQADAKILVSPRDYLAWRQRATSFDLLAAVRQSAFNLADSDEPLRISAWEATSTVFDMLGVRVALGRAFTTAEEEAAAPRTVVLGARLWRDHFGASPDVLGRTVRLDGRPATIVGVLGPSALDTDVIVPLVIHPGAATFQARTLFVMGRLRSRVNLAQARVEMTAIGDHLAVEYPEFDGGWTINTRPLSEEFLGRNAQIAYGLLAATVVALLLIACANVSNLVLARGLTRRREIAVRVALGAGRGRVARQLLVEALVLAGLSGAVGLVIGNMGLRWIRAAFVLPPVVREAMRIDPSAVVFAVAMAACSALLVGIVPALQVSRTDVASGLQEVSPRTIGGRGVRRLQSGLVIAQITLAVVLVVVAGLLVRTLINLEGIENQGFDPRGVMTARLTLSDSRYSPTAAATFFDRVVSRIESNRRVAFASAVSRVPAAGSRYDPNRSVVIEGRPVSSRDPVWALDLTVLPRSFDVLHIPVLEGRDVTARDAADTPLVVVINHTMAQRYWPGRSPIGARLRLGDEPNRDAWRTVVGVVGDVRNDKITDAPLPQLYVPLAQRPARTMTVVVRGRSDWIPPPDVIRSSVTAIDRDEPVYQVQTMEQVLDDDLAGSHSLVQLFALFAVLSIVLAASGVYAVISFGVTARAPEVGVRIALGASRSDVLLLVLGQSLRPFGLGLAIGLAAAFMASHVMASLLYRTAPTDPITYAGSAALFGAVALIAAVGPAIRATKVDPLRVLRTQ